MIEYFANFMGWRASEHDYVPVARFDASDRYIRHGVFMSITGISEKRTGK